MFELLILLVSSCLKLVMAYLKAKKSVIYSVRITTFEGHSYIYKEIVLFSIF